MGDRLTEEEPETAGDVFDRVFPDYLLMGMTPEQYWDGESELKKFYRKAYRQRMETEERIRDQQAWLTGIYIREALQSVAILVNGFVPKGAHAGDYPKLPKLEQAEREKKEANRKKREDNQTQLAMAMFQSLAASFNKGFNRRQEQKKNATPT